MTRTTSTLVGRHCTHASLTITAAAILGSIVGAAQKTQGAPSPGGSSGAPDLTVNASPQNALRFPYGVQRFEHIRSGTSITAIPGWKLQGSPENVSATIVKDPDNQPRAGLNSRSWMRVDDSGAGLADGFLTPKIVSPDPWDYAWSFDLRVDAPPLAGGDWPVLAIQHHGGSGFQDAWGLQLTDTGVNLFLTSTFGTPDSAPLFSLVSPTGVGEWVSVRVVASLEHNSLEAFVNGTSVARLGINPKAATNVTQQRLSYHGVGTGNLATLVLDEVGIAFLSGVCKQDLLVDFEADEDGTALGDGQSISSVNAPTEYGCRLTVDGTGGNGAAIFDSDTGGPNDPSQDTDLLVDQGNVLIIQNDASAGLVGDFFPNPNDDEDGGTFTFAFTHYLQPLSIDLIDIDDRIEEGMTITLTDYGGLTRTYTVPADWTGDGGVGTLDLQTLANQPGFNSTATAVEDAGFLADAVLGMVIENGGSGALDNFVACIPCVELTFETEDDGTPISAATPLVNGQDISTPPEFGVETTISSSGPNLGAATFDSTPGGPNALGPDKDLLVGLGNILILQNTTAPTQTVPGIFNVPNDDQDGGEIVFSFADPVCAHYVDLIDFDEEDVDGIDVILLDGSGKTRTYDVPGGYTEDLLNDGPPAFRRLDLTTLANQPGFLNPATASEQAGFDPEDVVQITFDFGGPGAIDNLCFCDCSCE